MKDEGGGKVAEDRGWTTDSGLGTKGSGLSTESCAADSGGGGEVAAEVRSQNTGDRRADPSSIFVIAENGVSSRLFATRSVVNVDSWLTKRVTVVAQLLWGVVMFQCDNQTKGDRSGSRSTGQCVD